jgi:acyl carrier protein
LAPAQPPAGRDVPFEAPTTAIEQTLAALRTEVLGVDRIGIHDDFFDLGGHSLQATQVLLRVREQLGVELPVRRFFETPTLAGLE